MLVNVFNALKHKMPMRRVAVLKMISDGSMHSTLLGKRLGVSRQLIDLDIDDLAGRGFVRTGKKKIGSAIKLHFITAAGTRLLAELADIKYDAFHYAKTSTKNGRCEHPSAKE